MCYACLDRIWIILNLNKKKGEENKIKIAVLLEAEFHC